MKKILFIFFIAACLSGKAQFTLEHTYDSAATYNNCSGNLNQLMLVNFEVSGEQYVRINRCGNKMYTYDLNHALVKTISLAGLPRASGNIVGQILYLSENLFDLDAGMEFLYMFDSAGITCTGIFDENGSKLFSEPGAPWVVVNFHMQQYPIYNTTAGTKLLLSYDNGQAKVFSVPGTLSTAIETINNTLLNSTNFISNPYPNPTSSTTKIDYKFPEGIKQGEIVFYDLSGNEIKRFKVDKSSDFLSVSTTELSAGIYYYQLQTSLQKSEGKKMVVIK